LDLVPNFLVFFLENPAKIQNDSYYSKLAWVQREAKELNKILNHNYKGSTEGNSCVPIDLYFKCSGRAALNFSFLSIPCGGQDAGPLSSRGVPPVDCLADT
jgi:hypothetical protein